MLKISNSIFAFIVAVVLILSMSCTAFAENISEESSQNVMRPIKINSELLKKYMPFAANLPNDENCLNILMNSVTMVKSYNQNGYAIVEYVPSGISNYFDYCETDDDMQSITSIDGALYVSYVHENYEVSMRYAEDGLSQLVVYDNISDTAFIKQESEYYLEEGFRYGKTDTDKETNGVLSIIIKLSIILIIILLIVVICFKLKIK